MPSVLTHYYCALRVLRELEKKNISVQRDAFIWGTQGPDIFFYHRFMPWKKESSLTYMGKRIHNEPPSLYLETCGKILREHKFSEPMRSYVLGTVCHYMLDREAHPFVLAKTKDYSQKIKKKEKNYPWHTQIETSLDIIILRYETGGLPTDVSIKMCTPKDEEIMAQIGRFWQEFLRYRFDKDISEREGAQLAQDMRSLFGLLNNRLLIKKPALECFERLTGAGSKLSCHLRAISEGELDYANNLRRPWCAPLEPEKVRHDSFFDIYEQTIIKTPKMISDFLICAKKERSMAELCEEKSFSGR